MSNSIPTITPESGMNHYLQEIQKFPMLEPEEEFMLAKRWREHEDTESAHRLVTSHLRLVAKVAMGYRGYGLPMGEVISEGNIGLMQAVKRFEPDRGFRLATYAIWWIRASIQEYILRSWSLVKMGTTAAHKRLFFNLRKVKSQIDALEEGDLTREHVTEIATRLGVPEQEVISMNQRFSARDGSLNEPMSSDAGGEWQEVLADEADDQETVLAERDELEWRKEIMRSAMEHLNEREAEILQERHMTDNPQTLGVLAERFGISRERIRQIEVRAVEKLRLAIRSREAKQEAARRANALVSGDEVL